MNAVILAAGFGTRLRPLTTFIPKPALQVGGKAIIRHILDNLEAIGIKNIIVKTHYLADKIGNAIGYDPAITICYDQHLIGTAQFLKQNAHLLEESFLVANGDTLTNLDYADIIELHLTKKNIATIFTKNDALHTAGTYIFDKEILNYIDDQEDIPDLMQTLIAKEIPINLYMSDAYYFDCGTDEKLQKARKYYETHFKLNES